MPLTGEEDMTARITASMTANGELELFLNEAGRDLLINELQRLAKTSGNDHFHLGAFQGAEVEMRCVPYRPSDTIIWSAKVMLRPDDWDAEHFPHVL
jgi:hypothetical protein